MTLHLYAGCIAVLPPNKPNHLVRVLLLVPCQQTMKFLEVASLQKLTSILQRCDLGDRIIHGRVEAYSCKRAGQDKRVSKEIQRQLASESTSVSPAVNSPLGPLQSSSTRKLLISLITTLNASFPDYDFSNLRADQFEHESSIGTAMENINSLILNSMEPIQPGFRDAFWTSVDDTIELNSCEIYSYVPDADTDVFAVGKLWSSNYFFYSKKRKMIVFFTANAVSKLHQHAMHIHSRRAMTQELSDDESSGGEYSDVDDDYSDAEISDDTDQSMIEEEEEEETRPPHVELFDWEDDGEHDTHVNNHTAASSTSTPSTSTSTSTRSRPRSKKSTQPRKHPRSTPTKSHPIKKLKNTPIDDHLPVSFSPILNTASFSPTVTSIASHFDGLQTSSPLLRPLAQQPHGPIDFHDMKTSTPMTTTIGSRP